MREGKFSRHDQSYNKFNGGGHKCCDPAVDFTNGEWQDLEEGCAVVVLTTKEYAALKASQEKVEEQDGVIERLRESLTTVAGEAEEIYGEEAAMLKAKVARLVEDSNKYRDALIKIRQHIAGQAPHKRDMNVVVYEIIDPTVGTSRCNPDGKQALAGEEGKG